MGNHRDKTSEIQEVYCLTKREVRIMSEVWKSVEKDLAHYGTEFYALLFRNHPEFFKYFQVNMPHEFQVDVPAMRTKFSLVCGTLAALFVDHVHKSQQREHLLGYVAMVHKDMNLNRSDMENFMMDMMEMLMQQFPKLLTADCVLAYVRFAGSLITQIQTLMKIQREFCRRELTEMEKKDRRVGCFPQAKFSWLSCHDENLIYGHPVDYWHAKSRHWTLQRAVWATATEERNSESSRRDTATKNSIINTSLTSEEDESSSSDENYERTLQRPFIFRKKLTPLKQNNLPITAGDRRLRRPELNASKTGVVRRKLSDDKNEWNRPEQPIEVRARRVSIVDLTARERRRRTNREKVTSNDRSETRELTIQKRIDTPGPTRITHDSSPDELEENDIAASSRSVDLPTGKIEKRDRGTSISNVQDDRKVIKRIPAGLSARNDPPSSIIGSGTTTSQSVKRNKRVSISNYRWISPRELDE